MVKFCTEELLASKLNKPIRERCFGSFADLQGSFRGQGQPVNWVWFCGAVAASLFQCLVFVLVDVDLNAEPGHLVQHSSLLFPSGLLAFQNCCNCFWYLPIDIVHFFDIKWICCKKLSCMGYCFQTILSRTECIKHRNFCLEHGIKRYNIYKLFSTRCNIPNENWFDCVSMYVTVSLSFSWNTQTARLSIVPFN